MPPDVELLPLAEVARRHVMHVLEACGGNRTNAAKILGVDRKTLYRWLVGYGVIVRETNTFGRVRFAIATEEGTSAESAPRRSSRSR